MSFIGEALLSAAITTLFDKLASSSSDHVLQFARQKKIDADLEEWKKILEKIKAVLDDAEEKQTTNRLVEIWLGELRNLAYDAEDILDEFATEALRRKLKAQASTSKVPKLIHTGLRSLKPNSAMVSQIKEITARLQKIVKEKNDFELKENSGTRPNQDRSLNQREPKTSLNEPHIYGRDEDKEAIVLEVLKDEGTDAKFSVVSIQGMGGLGKTTLAQLVYNDARVKDHFDITAWIYVSENFNVTQVTKTILHSMDPNTSYVNDLNMLQVKLKEKLSGKKFFIVLDDVWNESYENWTELCLPFECGSKGSKIIVTTRNRSVSRKVGALVPYQLKELSTNDCLSVFTRHSLGKEDFSEHECLEEIGKKIIRKCAGLPLAAKTLGGLLRGKLDCKQWEDVLESNIWNLPQEEKSGLVPALKAEEFGEEYFNELHSRSFFQQSTDYVSCFVIHDLINDLTRWAAKDFCFRIENLQEGEKEWKIPVNLRRLACQIDRSNCENIKESGAFNKMKSVRTFIASSSLRWFRDDFSDFLCMVLRLQRLRVLSLNGYPISELPNAIGNVKLLHHLDLSYTKIKFLPDSVNKLYNLETLILKGCYELERLCSDMGNLIKLRHLNVSNSYRLEAMPLRIGKLTSLRTLQRFVVCKDTRSGLKELKDLKHLQECLHISGLENVNDSVDAENANLNGKDGLKDIELEWTSRNDVSNEKDIAAQVLEKLKPCQKLESLHINGYGGTQFPWWLGDTSLSSLVSLTFEDCKNYASFPSIGKLPLLKKLVIRNVDGIESLGPEFYGHNSKASFQSLEEFNIESLQDLKVWFPCGSGRNVEAFPHLQKLSIRKCSKLEGKLPEHLPSLNSLLIEDCEQWMVSVPRLPEDCTIQIVNCKEVVLSSIKDCSSLSSMVHLFSGISSRIFIAEGFAQGFSKVEKLDIVAYDEPTTFLKSGNHSLQEFKKSMRMLSIEIGHVRKELPGRCQYLVLKGFRCPVKLKQALQSLCFLRGITIRNSKKIKFFPEASLPSQLRFIDIAGCDALQSLPMTWMHSSNTSLEKLSIRSCGSLKCIARVQLPSNLKRLEIDNCSNLLTVLDEEEVSGSCKNTSCAEKLKIEQLNITSCKNLQTLQSGINNPISLKKLKISSCSAMLSIPEGGFPTSLTSLVIIQSNICYSLFEWGLHRLTSLEVLDINGGCPDVMSFPQEEIGMILPASLKSLHIRFFPKLERLSSIAQNLPCLEKLFFSGCWKLKYFPDDGLPQSLKQYGIRDCPLLEERCKEGEGLYWSMIAHLSRSFDKSDYASQSEEE